MSNTNDTQWFFSSVVANGEIISELSHPATDIDSAMSDALCELPDVEPGTCLTITLRGQGAKTVSREVVA